ncbi:lasso peptide biosynthesis B2 protein [Calothrix sp. PCC 6303]|uniref:lasso peptide biosynthesis B2 protein n=1 Tax=Calothrix sp. PCC 6303 TaxID=1170562 RepID=UPI0002A00EF3|nr:lasso peptide biosynthesis B2 protein [Calothrix sp. PCC 6303]AFZ02150.1 hypothetical protein Cal6303_3209 [Calothrix sp. PCC 6303]
MRKLRYFLRMRSRDRILLLMTFILMGTIRLGLWLLPFRVLIKLHTKTMHLLQKVPNSTQVSLAHIIAYVNLSTRYMPGGAKCLARALTTQVLMHRYNHLGELRIGVSKNTVGSIEAHAWIEHQGQIIIGNLEDLPRFIPLPSLNSVKL